MRHAAAFERTAPHISPQQRQDSSSKLKPYLILLGPAGERVALCLSFSFFDCLPSTALGNPSASIVHRSVMVPDRWCQSSLPLASTGTRLTPPGASSSRGSFYTRRCFAAPPALIGLLCYLKQILVKAAPGSAFSLNTLTMSSLLLSQLLIGFNMLDSV